MSHPSRVRITGPLVSFRDGFAAELSKQGYPNLVVHGPLIATLLMDLVRRHRPDAAVIAFSFKAMRPTVIGHTLHLCANPSSDGKTVELWSRDHEGWMTMSALATIA